MRCPFCKLDNDRVLDTRAMDDGYLIRRRRRCGSCQRRFTTYERLEQFNLRVVKRDRSREPFDREKIRSGIERACWKRPVTTDQIEALVQEIEADICAFQESEVASEIIGEILMRRLLKVDQVAHVRFVSVYRDFTDVSDFIREISTLANLEQDPLRK